MLKKHLIIISIAAIFLFTFTITYAQEEQMEKNANKITQHKDMQKYMELIASDSTMRIEMMNLMIRNCEKNENALMGMGRTMIKNPEMHKMMKEMLNNDESKKARTKPDGKLKEHMIMESTETIKKPKYDSNQK